MSEDQTVVTGKRSYDRSVNFIAEHETIRPLRDQIIVKPLPIEFSSTLEVVWSGETVRGLVIAVGPGCYPNRHSRFQKDGKEQRTVRSSKQFRPTEVKVGDVVELGGKEIGGYLWTHVFVNGEDCIICREQDVCGIHPRST